MSNYIFYFLKNYFLFPKNEYLYFSLNPLDDYEEEDKEGE